MDMPAPKGDKEMMSSEDDDMPEDGVKHTDKFVDDFDDIHDGEISDSDVKVIEHLFKFSLEQYPDIFKYEFADGECEDEMKVVDVSAFEDSIMTHLKCGKHYVVIDTPKAAFADIEEDDMDESFALWVKANSVVSYHNDESTIEEAAPERQISDHVAIKKIFDKIKGTPNLKYPAVKQLVKKYLGMVNKKESDLDFLAAGVWTEIEHMESK
jgi:hypothetical protein